MDLAEIGIKVDSRQVRTANTELDKFSKSGKNAQRTTDRFGNTAEKSMGRVKKSTDAATRAFRLFGGVIAAVGAVRLTQSIVDASLAMESINSSLVVATGSADSATREFQFLRDESERLGLDLRSSADAFASLAAAARGTALEGQASRDIFIGVSEAMTTLGRDSFATEGALRAIEQMISKGNVSAEELRGQLGERLPGAFNLAAKAMGVTTQELNKMLQDGEVLAADMLPKLADELSKAFSEQAVAKAEGLQAQINRFKTAVFELMASGNMTDFSTAIGDFTELISDPNFQQSFDSFLSGVIQLAQWSGQAAAGMADLGKFMGENLARNIHGPLLDTPAEIDKAIADAESQLKLLDQELESSRLFRINPFKSDAELMADYSSLVNQINSLKQMKQSLDGGFSPVELIQPPEQLPKMTVTAEPSGGGGEGKKQDPINTNEMWWDWYPDAAEKAMIDTEEVISGFAPQLFEDIPKEARGNFDQMSEFATQAARNMQDAFADGFFDLFTGKTNDLAETFSTMLQRMAADLAASSVLNFLVGGLGSGGGLGGIVGDVVSNFGGARADGGPVRSGSTYLVGERGPELFTPNQGGQIIPNGQSGGGVSVNVNVDASGSSVESDDEQANRLGRSIGASVRSILIEEQRPGGVLNRA